MCSPGPIGADAIKPSPGSFTIGVDYLWPNHNYNCSISGRGLGRGRALVSIGYAKINLARCRYSLLGGIKGIDRCVRHPHFLILMCLVTPFLGCLPTRGLYPLDAGHIAKSTLTLR